MSIDDKLKRHERELRRADLGEEVLCRVRGGEVTGQRALELVVFGCSLDILKYALDVIDEERNQDGEDE